MTAAKNSEETVPALVESERRVLTTHAGSLPSTAEARRAILGEYAEASSGVLDQAVASVVRRQCELGIDIVNDGETGRISYWDVLNTRLAGIEPFSGEADSPYEEPGISDYRAPTMEISGAPHLPIHFTRLPRCTGPIAHRGPNGLTPALSRLRRAIAGHAPLGTFVTSISPGVAKRFTTDAYYGDTDAFLAAAASAMAVEYQAVLDAGFTLQIDAPDLARLWRFCDPPLAARRAAVHTDMLRRALAGTDPARVRLHVCWGNTERTHRDDVPLQAIIEMLLSLPVGGFVVEAANPRHGHEWRAWQDQHLEGRYVVVGVIDTTTNYVEHPRLIADRICQYASIIGPERTLAGTDCGMSSAWGWVRVHPDIAWLKLEALAEGARLATKELW
jgi:5-methyltetrahydropteroyltriglutamate--homocysteine methyltransferase